MTKSELLRVLEVLERYKLRIPSTVYYELKADLVDLEEEEAGNEADN